MKCKIGLRRRLRNGRTVCKEKRQQKAQQEETSERLEIEKAATLEQSSVAVESSRFLLDVQVSAFLQ